MLLVYLVSLYVLPSSVYSWYMPQTYPPYDPVEARMVRCLNYNLSKLGCHNERDPGKPYLPLAVPEMILTTDSSSEHFVGYERSTFPIYGDFLARFICDCADKVGNKGYTHFSISNYFECWSGKNVARTYDMYKGADGCVRGDKRHCDTNSVGLCAGAGGLHFVYALKTLKPTQGITSTVFVTPSITSVAPVSGLSVKCGNNVYKLTKLGCWNEVEYSRAYPELMLTAVDHYNQHLYAGYYLDTTNYDKFLSRFTCDCASATYTKGYSIFGVRSYGECWSGPEVACTYQNYGRASDCVNQKKWKCTDSSSMLCASPNAKSIYAFVLSDSKEGTTCTTKPSTQTTQSVTTIATPSPKSTPKVVPSPKTTQPVPVGKPSVTCGTVRYKLVKLGCWREWGDVRPPRALPELLLTARDTTSKVYAGYEFNRHNYAAFLQRFICDCVNKVNKKGYSVFGLQFYGECWSSPRAGCTYQKFGKTSRCVNQDMSQCSDGSTMLCSGDSARSVYVYIPDDILGGATCPTYIPTQPQTTPQVIITPKITPKISTTTKITTKFSSTHKTITTPQTTPRVTTPDSKGPPVVKCGNVEYKLTKLGCWNELGDTRPPRAMPELLLTSRDKTSPAYVGYDFNRHNYAVFLERFICDCVHKVNQKGYSVFGLQFYGECWSGPRVACTYDKFGKTNGCVNENHATCSDDSRMLCSGNSAIHTYVYVPGDNPGLPSCSSTTTTRLQTTPKIITTPKTTPKILTTSKTTPKVLTTPKTTPKILTTPKATPKILTTPKITPIPTGPARIKCGDVEYKLTKLGCWREFGHIRPPRVLPELLLTAKDKKSNVYAGYEFYKQKYEDFIHRFACDCLTKVQQKGYSVFGVQFYGECWSGPRAACTYKTFGKSYNCVDEKLGKCLDKSSRLCAGQNREDIYVYIPADTPGALTCPTTIPTTPKTTLTTTTPTNPMTTPKTTPIPTGPPRIKCGNVEYRLTKLGCWKDLGDITPPRAMPELLLTARDTWSSVYAGYDYHKMGYEVFIKRFICDCVNKVNQKGYTVFGLQFYGECWSGQRVGCTYKKFGQSDECVNENLKQCSDSTARLCSGHSSQEMYVYVPTHPPPADLCPTTPPTSITTLPTTVPTGPPRIKCGNVEYKLTKLGCWKDLGDITPPRAMPELLLTARDTWSSVYAGYEYHKMGYDVFIKRFICDCVNKVNQKGYTIFGLQFYGECWSGPRVGCTYKKFGHSKECVNENLKQCSDSTPRLCSGHSSQEMYVYVPSYPPPADLCPTTPPTSMTTLPTTVPTGPPRIQCRDVEYKLVKLGCWKELGDTRPPRAIPELLLTARDKKSSVYVGYEFEKQKFENFIQRFTCDCVKKVTQKGYSVFGVQFYGECWSGPRVGCTYKKFGQSDGCVNEKRGQCADKSTRICSGHSSQEIYVYIPADIPGGAICPTTSPTPSVTQTTTSVLTPSVTPTTPSVTPSTPSVTPTTPSMVPTNPTVRCGNDEYKLRKLGCWTERRDSNMPRALSELLVTARDSQSSVYAGYKIDTSNYAQFLEQFICDCIARVNSNGYSIFGLKFYGECWSGPRAECTYERYGQSNRCMNERKSTCSDKSSMLCSGDGPSNAYVYVRVDVALPTCPASPTSTVTTRSTPTVPTTVLTVSPTTPDKPRTSPTTPSTPTITPSQTRPVTSPSTTPTSPSIPPDFECKKALDIVIALDSSGSVMRIPYLRIRNFVSRLTRRFTSFKPTYFGLLHYNYRVTTSATLQDQIPNSMTLRNRIRDMGYLGQATLTQSALTSAKALFDSGARNDPDVQKILILFTDGRTYGGKQTLREPLKRLRESGVRVTAVAVGREDYLDRYSLLLMAQNQSNLVIIPSLDDLGRVERYVDQVTYMVCPK